MLPQLDITTYPSQVIFLIISFLSLFFVIRFFIVPYTEKNIMSFFQKINSLIQETSKIENECEQLQYDYEREYTQAWVRINEIQQEKIFLLEDLYLKRKKYWLTTISEENEKNMLKQLKSIDREWENQCIKDNLMPFTKTFYIWSDFFQGKNLPLKENKPLLNKNVSL
jgi:hypothetical protein